VVDADGEYIIELVALQGVLTQSELASPVYAWLSGVIETASSERRNVRVSCSCICLPILYLNSW
jgi:ABC-type Fe3+-siderophore transport system permease subunit